MKQLVIAALVAAIVAVSGCTDTAVENGEKTIQVNSTSECFEYTEYHTISQDEGELYTVCFEPQQVIIEPDRDQEIEHSEMTVHGQTTVNAEVIQK